VKTHLLDCIRDARLGEGVVLERPTSEETLALESTGVEQILQSVIPAHSRIVIAYCHYCKKCCRVITQLRRSKSGEDDPYPSWQTPAGERS
jgi:hypothetical protein